MDASVKIVLEQSIMLQSQSSTNKEKVILVAPKNLTFQILFDRLIPAICIKLPGSFSIYSLTQKLLKFISQYFILVRSKASETAEYCPFFNSTSIILLLDGLASNLLRSAIPMLKLVLGTGGGAGGCARYQITGGQDDALEQVDCED